MVNRLGVEVEQAMNAPKSASGSKISRLRPVLRGPRSARRGLCASENDAKERALASMVDYPVELWGGPRRVIRYSSKTWRDRL